MREKKSMKKISDADVKATFTKKARQSHFDELAKGLKDNDLYDVNLGKDGLHAKREKLAKDRFKRKNTDGHLKSKTEQNIIKKFQSKGPVMPVKKEVEIFDVWGAADNSLNVVHPMSTYVEPSKRIQKFKDYTAKSLTKVKAVMQPLPGQSSNPALADHQKLLKSVVGEEEKQIEDAYKGSA